MAKIVFRPTCSRCLEILDDETIDIHYDEEIALNDKSRIVRYAKDFQMEPARCPYCGEYFEGIIMPSTGKFPVKDSDLMRIV